jgi:hypothetical protein
MLRKGVQSPHLSQPNATGGFNAHINKPEQHCLSKIQCIGLHSEAVDLRGWGYGGVSLARNKGGEARPVRVMQATSSRVESHLI